MIQFYTYIYKDPSKNMESFYVGKGSGKRAYDHLKKIRGNPHFHYKVQKMLREGVQPKIEIYNMPDEKCAFDLEKILIKFYGRKDLDKGPLLNLTEGGDSGPNRSGKPGYWLGKIGPRLGKKDPALSKRMKENN